MMEHSESYFREIYETIINPSELKIVHFAMQGQHCSKDETKLIENAGNSSILWLNKDIRKLDEEKMN
jgi:hypothetical protein